MAKKEIGCAINPACGHMEFDHLEKTDKPLKVGIVGGGPAGMEAARIATVRGHKVTLFEKTGELGGAILGCCMAPGKEKMKWYADWIRTQIKQLNVDVRLRTCPTVEDEEAPVPGAVVRCGRPLHPGTSTCREHAGTCRSVR